MNYLVTAEEMRRYDANTIGKIGIPGMVLMERAALAVRDYILEYISSLDKNVRHSSVSAPCRVLVMVGTGNNGGDGLALARLLAERGIFVDVWCVGSEEKASEQWHLQREILKNYEVELCDNLPLREYTIMADALFGVGLSREVSGKYADAIRQFNEKNGWKVAVDIPSGIDADSGRVLGCAVRADATVTFGFAKRGLYLFPGAEYAGEVRVADIGITERSFLGEEPEMFFLRSPKENMPRRAVWGNKSTFGKVLLIAGEKGMAGAAVLSARAAYRVGAGMVKVLTDSENREILQKAVPEALYGTFEEVVWGLAWADVVAIGPGLGKSDAAKEVLEAVILETAILETAVLENGSHGVRKPLLIDADGLNLLAENEELQRVLAAQERKIILTPHVGELSRLLGRPIPVLKEKLWEHGMELAEKLHAVVVAKDARTFVCQSGSPVCMNVLGNSGMATAGSGDVLAGAIAGLWAQYEKVALDSCTVDFAYTAGSACKENFAYTAACQGVLLHAMSGDLAAKRWGGHACMAGDIAEALAEAALFTGE